MIIDTDSFGFWCLAFVLALFVWAGGRVSGELSVEKNNIKNQSCQQCSAFSQLFKAADQPIVEKRYVETKARFAEPKLPEQKVAKMDYSNQYKKRPSEDSQVYVRQIDDDEFKVEQYSIRYLTKEQLVNEFGN